MLSLKKCINVKPFVLYDLVNINFSIFLYITFFILLLILYLWDFCEVLTLTKNMRLLNGASYSDILDRKLFFDCVLAIDDGTIGESNNVDITIGVLPDLLISSNETPLHLLFIALIQMC